MTFEEAALLPRSEKVTLVTMLAEQRAKLFTVHDALLGIYIRSVDHFVETVKELGFALYEATSYADLEAYGTEAYYYSPLEKKVYVCTAGGLDPKECDVSLVYKFHFSNAPLVLPHDLASGASIEWTAIIDSIGNIGQQLDDQNSGIVMESQSSVSLINNSGFFDDIFDTLLWENKEVSFYSWLPVTPISEARKIFSGVIESKDFSPEKVTFKVKDFIFRMRDVVNLGSFSDLDGDVLDSYIGKPKRRIYGRVNKCQSVPIDCVKSGYALTGTVTIAGASKTVTGTTTEFLKEITPGDTIIFTINGEPVKYTINSVASDTSAEISKEADQSITAASAIIYPTIPYRFKNRRWHLSGHKLRSSLATITTVINSRTFVADDNSEFFEGDVVTINGTTTQVTRVSGLQIILEQFIFPVPNNGDTINKVPVLRSYFGNNRLILGRDFTVTNTTEAIIELDVKAEFNIAKERQTSITFTFTNTSRSVTTASTVDLRTLIKPRDWIRKVTQSNDVWFEVLEVDTQTITLRTAFSEATGTEVARIKNVEIINDGSLITSDCYGMDYGSTWVRTASNAVKHLVINDAGFASINTSAFSQADSDCKYTLAMVIPENVGDDAPEIRDVVTKINDSVFGSLYGNSSQEICYSIVNTRRPSSMLPIKDDDLVSWSSESVNDIANRVVVSYSPFIDTVSGVPAFETYSHDSSFVNKYIGISNTKEITCYLYDTEKATIMAQRMAFYKSLPSLKITLIGKALFFGYSVNDRLYLELERLYKRYGSSTKRKIGIVSSVKIGQYDSEIVVSDMGNIFNRCPSIAENTTPSFSTATEDEKIKYGFILSPETLTPDITSEDELGNCLLG